MVVWLLPRLDKSIRGIRSPRRRKMQNARKQMTLVVQGRNRHIAGRFYPAMRTHKRKTKMESVAEHDYQEGHSRLSKLTYHENAKHLRYQHPVARNATPVFQQFSLCTLDVVCHRLDVVIDPTGHRLAYTPSRHLLQYNIPYLLSLLLHHMSKLREHASKLVHSAFDHLDSLPALPYVRVMHLRLLHHQELCLRRCRFQRQRVLLRCPVRRRVVIV